METSKENTYKKYCPNVFVAKCTDRHGKGDIITLTTKYGKEHECEVHNYLGKTNDGAYLYSITRSDGFDARERARKKAEKLNGYASNAEKRSDEAYNSRASKHELEFMRLGEPIKIGHHSERRHRKLFEKYDNKMCKSIEERDRAKEYQRRAEYWESKSNDINLSMPESLEFYEYKLQQAKKHHLDLKENPEKRAHGMSLQYANKAVRDAEKNLKLAVRLWGSAEEIEQTDKEKEEESKNKLSKKPNFEGLKKEYGGFFFFGSDAEAFRSKHRQLIDEGYIEEGEKVFHLVAGFYAPVKHKDIFIRAL